MKGVRSLVEFGVVVRNGSMGWAYFYFICSYSILFHRGIFTSKDCDISNMFSIKSIHDPQAREEAADLVVQGKPVGIFNRGVCAIWGDGNNPKFYEQVTHIKGEGRQKKPLATTLLTKDFIPLIDESEIPPVLHSIFLNPDALVERTGSLCFLRVPIKKEIASKFPPYVVSKNEEGGYEMQNWDANGHAPTHAFIEALLKRGITLPAVTSMNYSGTPEIVDQDEGVEFAKKSGIQLFLIDDKDLGRAKGSFAIVGVGRNGINLVRDGHLPAYIFPYLFEVSIDTAMAGQAKFPQIEFPQDYFSGESPQNVRKKIIDYLSEQVSIEEFR